MGKTRSEVMITAHMLRHRVHFQQSVEIQGNRYNQSATYQIIQCKISADINFQLDKNLYLS